MKLVTLVTLVTLATLMANAQTTWVALNVTAGYSHAVQTNQLVQPVSIGGALSGYYPGGNVAMTTGNIYTGLTNVVQGSGGYSTLQITTPGTCVVSNYVPADAVVIPASVTGNVQIILESSPDLVNWTAANPGTYGASAATNRFFRVRAAVQ